jgi:hypothetical protein
MQTNYEQREYCGCWSRPGSTFADLIPNTALYVEYFPTYDDEVISARRTHFRLDVLVHQIS